MVAEAQQEAAAIRADAQRQRTEMLEEARADAAAAEVIRAAEEWAAAVAGHRERGGRADPRRSAQCSRAELITASREREQRLAEVGAEAAGLAERPRAEADEELRVYTERRRREAYRLARAARREREAPPSQASPPTAGPPESCALRNEGHHSGGPGTAMARRLRSGRLRRAAVLDAPPGI